MGGQAVARWKQQLAGGAMFLIAAAMTVWFDARAMEEGHFFLKPSLIPPAFAIVGLALVLVPDYRAERRARGEDISVLTGAAAITPRWWLILGLALLASAANFWWLQAG